MSSFVSRQLDQNSEKDLKNSLPSLTSVQLIGSYHGQKKPWYLSLKLSLKNSKSLILNKKQKKPSIDTWVMSISWFPKFVTFTSKKWEKLCSLLQSLSFHTCKPIKLYTWVNISMSMISKRKHSEKELVELMMQKSLSVKWMPNWKLNLKN